MTWIFLSHILSETTPLYGSGGNVLIDRVRSISSGDSSNSSELQFPAHAGTHVDAPRHFDDKGMALDEYPPDYWRACRTMLLDIPSSPGEILDLQKLGPKVEAIPQDCDLLLLRTGAETWRSAAPKIYSENGPGISADLAHWLRANRRLKFLGMDFISVSSFSKREVGRDAHRAFLAPHETGAPPILLIEDMSLSKLFVEPSVVYVVPMLFSKADGAPATVLAQL